MQQRRTQAVTQYPAKLENGPNMKSQPGGKLMADDLVLQYSCSQNIGMSDKLMPNKLQQQSKENQHSNSYYVQMLKSSHGNKLNNRQTLPEKKPGFEGAILASSKTSPVMPDHLNDIMC